MRKRANFAAFLAMAGVLGMGIPSFNDEGKPNPKKCSLPSCENLTEHNGGYCCAEHCRQHRAEIRANKA